MYDRAMYISRHQARAVVGPSLIWGMIRPMTAAPCPTLRFTLLPVPCGNLASPVENRK